jgi:hypothetical protein
MCLGCAGAAIPGYQPSAGGNTTLQAYAVADASYNEDVRNSRYSTYVNEPASVMAQGVAESAGLGYMGYNSEEAGTTVVNAELGPVSNFALFSTSLSALEMVLPNSAVTVDSAVLDVQMLPMTRTLAGR